MVMIAPSLQFPGRLAWQLGPAAMEEWKRTGVRRWESEWLDLEIGFGLMDDALNYDPQKLLVGYQAPTLILHGMKDDAVDWRTSLGFVEDCRYPGLELLLLKDGDHRLTDHKAFLFDVLWAWLQREGGR
jgi:alpha-beta hydrolase superfamily lysophospholipase